MICSKNLQVLLNGDKMGDYCIYLHTNLVNGLRYVGKAKGKPANRWGTQGRGYLTKRGEKYVQPYFARAINEYGWDNFSHEILVSNLTNEEACNRETFFIQLFRTTNPQYRYNNTLGGEGSPRRKISEETRKKMSESQKKRFENPLEREKLKNNKHWLGRHHSEETKRKISQKRKGQHLTAETKEKLSKTLKGRKLSEETKQKMKAGRQGENANHYGKKHSEESKKKMSESKIGKHTGAENKNSKRVKCIETRQEFESGSLAAKFLTRKTIQRCHICAVCRGERKICLGYHWIFV